MGVGGAPAARSTSGGRGACCSSSSTGPAARSPASSRRGVYTVAMLVIAALFASTMGYGPLGVLPSSALSSSSPQRRGASSVLKRERSPSGGASASAASAASSSSLTPAGLAAAERRARAWDQRASQGVSQELVDKGYYLPIAGVYVFNRRPTPFLHSLRAYRRAYPQENLYLFCDNGCYNYTRAASHFGAKFDGRPREIVTKNAHRAFYIGPANAKAFLVTYREAVNNMNEPFFIQLEDDVFVIKAVATPLKYDINGWAPDKFLVGEAEAYVRTRNPEAPPTLTLGGFGGCIFRTSFWKRILNLPTIEEEIDALYDHGKVQSYGVDYIFASLVYRFNGTLGPFDGYVEAFEPRADGMRREGKVEVLHGFKDLYKTDHLFTWEDREILGPDFERTINLEGTNPG
jgi:hypothetical protein